MVGVGVRRCLAATATAAIAVVTILASTVSTNAQAAASRSLPAGTHFYSPGFETPAKQQWAKLIAQGDRRDAGLISAMEKTPRGVWLDGGSPKTVRVTVRSTANKADAKGQVPVFVAYNIPGRDCANLSAGGATDTAQYEAWIDGIAEGLGSHRAVVILEPDSLGLLPSDCGLPASTFPFTDTERYTELNFAVNRLERQPNVSVYLDGTHSAWLNVADAATRLVTAGVQKAQGFFLDVSNYQFTPNLVQYGTWISDCITYATAVDPGNFSACPDQYYNGGPFNNFASGVALSSYGVWSDGNPEFDLNSQGENERYASMLGSTAPTTHFVVDTSRNGLGPWEFPAGTYPDPQDWCNPPDRGLGAKPTVNTGNPLVDAYLWIKVPGESDGPCNRGISGSTTDPIWSAITGNPSFTDPAAGQWFPQQALQLARLANPSLH